MYAFTLKTDPYETPYYLTYATAQRRPNGL